MIKLAWTTAQESTILVPVGCTVAVSAGAGTGKTSVLTEVVAREMVMGRRVNVANLLVLTFTRKAAAEMAERIEGRLVELAASAANPEEKTRLLKAAGEVADAAIETLDAFAARLLRERAAAAGLDSSFEILDADEAAHLGYRIACECLERWLDQPPHEGWRQLVRETRVRDWPTLLAATEMKLLSRGEPDLGIILLGRDKAGLDVIQEQRGLLKDLADRMEKARSDLVHDLDTFKSLLEETANFPTKDGSQKNYHTKSREILATLAPLRKWLQKKPLDWGDPVLKSLGPDGVWKFWSVGRAAETDPRVASGKLGQQIRTRLTGDDKDPDTFRALTLEMSLWTHREALASAILDFHRAHVAARREKNVLSFADCEIEALRLLENDQRTRDEMRRRFEYVIVDEYQDINPLQQKLIYALCRPADDASKPPENLYVVGDERQSIYGFRDADCRIIRELRETDGAESRGLRDNFRGRPALLNFVNHAFRQIWGASGMHVDLLPAFPGYMNERGKSTQPSRIEMRLVRADDVESGRRREAADIARRLDAIVREECPSICMKGADIGRTRPIQWRDCAVLMRARAPMILYEEAFAALDIPFRTESGGGFWERREIADIRALLRCLSPISDDIDWAVLLRSPWVGLSDDGLLAISTGARREPWQSKWRDAELPHDDDRAKLEAFGCWFDKLLPLAGRIPVATLLESALDWSGYAQRVFAQEDDRAIQANVEKLLSILRSDEKAFDVGSTANYLDWLTSTESPEAQATVSALDEEGAVTIATVHAAKGLEWPLVVLPDLRRPPKASPDDVLWDESLGIAFRWMNPSTGSSEKPARFIQAAAHKKEFEAEEEKRLLYVALTRPREWLILSSTAKPKKSKDKEPEWDLGGKSWLNALNDSFQNEDNTLAGHPGSVEEEMVSFEVFEPESPGDKAASSDRATVELAIRRFIHAAPSAQLPPRARIEPSQEKITALHSALDSLAPLPPNSARQYLVTATDVATFDHCPRMFAYRSVWAVPQLKRALSTAPAISGLGSADDELSGDDEVGPSENFEMPATEWGDLAHAVMQQVPFDASRGQINALVAQAFEERGLSGADREHSPDRLAEMVEKALKLRVMGRINTCGQDHIWREFRLLGKPETIDEVLVGTLDVLALCDGRPVVIDYKSGRVKKEEVDSRAKDYEIQLALYAVLASGRYGLRPQDVEVHILFLEPSEDVRVEIGDSNINRALDAVRKLSERSRERNFTADPSPEKCSRCDYRDICRYSALKTRAKAADLV